MAPLYTTYSHKKVVMIQKALQGQSVPLGFNNNFDNKEDIPRRYIFVTRVEV